MLRFLIENLVNMVTLPILSRNIRGNIRIKLKTRIYAHKIFRRSKVGKNFICKSFSVANRNTTIGDDVYAGSLAVTGNGEVTIGNNCVIAGAQIITQNHNYDLDALLPFGNSYISKPVNIDDLVWIGSGVTILPGTHIGEGAIIQACSVVHGDIPPCAIAGGNPAKVFKYRDMEHFNKLKADKKFLTMNFENMDINKKDKVKCC